MNKASLEYVVKQLEELDPNGPIITPFEYDDDDSFHASFLRYVSKASEKTIAGVETIRANLMKLIHGNLIDPQLPPGIGLGNLTVSAKLFASIHVLLTHFMAFERVLPNNQTTLELPNGWNLYINEEYVYRFQGRNWTVSIAVTSTKHLIYLGAQESETKYKVFRYLSSLVPSFEIGDMFNDKQRFAYLNSVLNHLKNNVVLKVINGNFRNSDSSVTPPPELMNQLQ